MFHVLLLPLPHDSYLYHTTFHGELFLGIHETGKFKELHKIEEEVIRERAVREI
jgi:hypothetical protein